METSVLCKNVQFETCEHKSAFIIRWKVIGTDISETVCTSPCHTSIYIYMYSLSFLSHFIPFQSLTVTLNFISTI